MQCKVLVDDFIHASKVSVDGKVAQTSCRRGKASWSNGWSCSDHGLGRHRIQHQTALHVDRLLRSFWKTTRFDKSISGPYRIMWGTLFDQYPQIIQQIIIVNAPSFVNVLHTACSPFLPNDYKVFFKIEDCFTSQWFLVKNTYFVFECTKLFADGYSCELPSRRIG